MTVTVSNWMNILMLYTFKVEWIPRILNTLPDLLSKLYESKVKEDLLKSALAAILLRDDKERKSLDLEKEEDKKLAMDLI